MDRRASTMQCAQQSRHRNGATGLHCLAVAVRGAAGVSASILGVRRRKGLCSTKLRSQGCTSESIMVKLPPKKVCNQHSAFQALQHTSDSNRSSTRPADDRPYCNNTAWPSNGFEPTMLLSSIMQVTQGH